MTVFLLSVNFTVLTQGDILTLWFQNGHKVRYHNFDNSTMKSCKQFKTLLLFRFLSSKSYVEVKSVGLRDRLHQFSIFEN